MTNDPILPPYDSQAHMFKVLQEARWANEPIPEIGLPIPVRISYSAIRNAGRYGAGVILNPTQGCVDLIFPDGSEIATNIEGSKFFGPPISGDAS